ncbi:peptidoglycan-binding protein [bacterium]|nr:MAG: peptidoglycan-binding protein [bacterium]
MAVLRIGSKGDGVKKIQQRLKDLNLYKGPVDGEFGGGTEAAVKAYQLAGKLKPDGIVGSELWLLLFGEARASAPDILAKPLDYRCLALTGSFETNKGIPECFAGLSGDFDGQGISLGVLQWNFGQGSLNPLLKEMITKHQDAAQMVFHENLKILAEVLKSSNEVLMNFVRSIQHPVKHFIYEPWKGMFKALCRTEEFQNIQRTYAFERFGLAIKACKDYGLWSERASALMFDINVQNGSISTVVKAQIMADFKNTAKDLSDDETEISKMRIIANRRAEAATKEWVEDVRARKLCVANGNGVVHGVNYNIEEQFGIRLKRF